MPEIKTSSSVSNKPKYIILIFATICILIFLGFFIFKDKRDSPIESKSEHSNKESIQNVNSSDKNGKWVPRHYINRQIVCKSCTGKSCTRCFGRGWYYSVEEVPGHYE